MTQANTRRFFALDFDLITMSGDPTLAGLDVTVTGNVSGGTPTDTAGGGTIVDAGNESNLGLFVEACIQSGGGFSACLMDATTASAAGSFPSPVSSESGTASWLIATDATGSATFLSARYSFDQVVLQVPEPHALLLWGIALAGLAFSIRKRIAA